MLASKPPLVTALVGLAAVFVTVVIAVGVGSITVAPQDVLRVLADHALPFDVASSPIADPIIWSIRLPRVLTAFAAGAALGMGGVALQGLFRNPVADPQLVGLSATSAIGVMVGLWIGWEAGGPVAGILGGVIAGILGASAVRSIATSTQGDPSRFILAGIGFGVAVSAMVAAAAIAIHDPRIPDVPFWFVGGLGASTWGTALWTTMFAGASLAVVWRFAGRLDVFSLGMASARHLGIDVAVVTTVTLMSVGAGVGAAVGAAGVIAFVGLVAAHGARALVGDHHRRSLLGGFVLGGIFLVTADAMGRVIGGRFEVPVGLVTAAIGGPFLLWLIVRRRLGT
jgi:iron complex transport system permease protein